MPAAGVTAAPRSAAASLGGIRRRACAWRPPARGGRSEGNERMGRHTIAEETRGARRPGSPGKPAWVIIRRGGDGMGDKAAARVRRAGGGSARRSAAGAVLLALLLLPAGQARAAGFDLVFGAGRVEGSWQGDEDVALDDLYLQVEFGGPTSRVSIRAPYVRMDRTGNQTFSPEGPIVLGAGGFGRPPWQEREAGESASGFGDILVRTETWLVKSGPGNKPTVSFLADYKWATADESEGLGTGESDYGGGFDYLQPLGKRFQIRGEAFYRFTGSPEGVDFKDRLR